MVESIFSSLIEFNAKQFLFKLNVEKMLLLLNIPKSKLIVYKQFVYFNQYIPWKMGFTNHLCGNSFVFFCDAML